MTFEELKEEAEKQGYTLVKFKKRERLLPCVCGHNRRTEWQSTLKDSVTLECNTCGLTAEGRSRAEAVRNWNEMIRKYTADKWYDENK